MWLFSITVFAVPVTLRTGFIRPDASAGWIVAVVAALIVMHILEVGFFMWKGYLAALVMGTVVMVIMIMNFSVSALALRLLGIGGGIPISMVVKIADADSGKVPIRRMDGCLVLSFGTQLVVQSSVDGGTPPSQCHLNPATFVPGDVPMAIHIFNRSDVVDIRSIGKKS